MERRLAIIVARSRKIVNFHDVLRKRQWKERAVFGVFSSLLLFSQQQRKEERELRRAKVKKKHQKRHVLSIAVCVIRHENSQFFVTTLI
jgi:hypothetical protein